jgi:Uma2 family endonuclease
MNPLAGTPQQASIGEPTWEVAKLFPNQGAWSEGEYLALNGNYLIEFSDGCLEVLPMPTTSHQMMVLFLHAALAAFVAPRKMGLALVAPLRVRLWSAKYREPDVVFMLAENLNRSGEEFWEGADLVMEVVSDHDRRRDLEIKRSEYAEAGIPEYWIVDPQQSLVTVLRLDGAHYAVHGAFSPGAMATSALLAGFEVDVAALFAQRLGS